MSSLWRSIRLLSVGRPQISPIACSLVSIASCHTASRPTLSQFTPPRITCDANRRFRRPFSRILIRRPLLRSSRVIPTVSQAQVQRSRPLHDYQQRNPRDGKIFIGTIIATCTTVYVWHYMAESKLRQGKRAAAVALDGFNKTMVLSLQNIREGRYYTLLTSAFAHQNGWHLVVNMMALWSFAPTATYLYGVPTFAVLYLGSAIAGSLAQVWYWEKHGKSSTVQKGLGASGAIFGIFGALACAMPGLPVSLMFVPISFPIWMASVVTVGVSVGALREGWLSQIGHAAHLGGMAFGAFWWLVAMRRGKAGLRLGFKKSSR